MKVAAKCVYRKLRGRIIEYFGSAGGIASELGISQAIVSMKLNGITPFSKQDMIDWGNVLDIPKEEYVDYFFCDELAKL